MAQAMAGVVTLQQEDTEEEDECIHLMSRRWCSVCKNGPTVKKTYTTSAEVRVLVEGRFIPSCDPWIWSPINSRESICSIPANCRFVHISGTFSAVQVRQLIEHLENLVAIEITPSVAHIVEKNIQWYKLLGIRIVVRCRYRQS